LDQPWATHIKLTYSADDNAYCFVINSNATDKLELSGTNKLELVLDVSNRELSVYTYDRLSSPEIKLYLYERGSGPDLTTSQILTTGMTNFVKFDELQIELQEGYGTSACSSKTAKEVSACVRECVARNLAQKCCNSDHLDDCAGLVIDAGSDCAYNYSACVTKPLFQSQCFSQLQYSANGLFCETAVCPTPCFYTRFTLTNQLGKFPNPLASSAINAIFGDPSYSDSNLIQLKLYRATEVVRLQSESPKQTFANLVGSIGGTLGLWCGMSIMTVAEFIEFFAVLTVVWMGGLACGARRSTSGEPSAVTKHGANDPAVLIPL